MTNLIYAETYQRAAQVAREIGLDLMEWKYIAGPDDIHINVFNLILNKPMTMGLDYRISVARASGGVVTVREYLT